MTIRQHDFTIERRFRQAPAQAFRAFADPALKRRWFGAPESWADTNWELDFRVGGAELSVGRDPSGALHEFRSRYHDIVDGERIVFAYDLLLDGRLISVSLTTVEVRPDADGTRLVFTEHGAFFDDLEDPAERPGVVWYGVAGRAVLAGLEDRLPDLAGADEEHAATLGGVEGGGLVQEVLRAPEALRALARDQGHRLEPGRLGRGVAAVGLDRDGR